MYFISHFKFKVSKIPTASSDLLYQNWCNHHFNTLHPHFYRHPQISTSSALSAIRKLLFHRNSQVVMNSLLVLECLVKNCGQPMHEQVTQYEFLEELKELVRVSFELVYFILAILNMIWWWLESFIDAVCTIDGLLWKIDDQPEHILMYIAQDRFEKCSLKFVKWLDPFPYILAIICR